MDKFKQKLSRIRKSKAEESNRPCIIVSSGTCGEARGSKEVFLALKNVIKKYKLGKKVDIRLTGCHGFCQVEPIIIIHPENIFYQSVQPEDAEEIISETIINKNIIDHLLFKDPNNGKKIKLEKDIPFYKKQNKLLLKNNASIDPFKIEDYIGIGGYSAILKVLSKMKPEKVIDTIKESGIRGRGGAGFPTGIKWSIAGKTEGKKKYIVCNADEGDPGAYMDRSILEGNPHSVLEGMMIGANAIGAREGFIYIRYEYPLAVTTIDAAIKQAKKYRLLGKNILGTGFDFDIKIVRGAGAFVCGEETALMASIEGKKGEPRQRPPFPAERGIWNKPTNINNVETWANVPLIINNGAKWYSKIGTKGSKGTKIFSLVGKINNTGLVEVPMGISLKEMIYDIGGGIPENKNFKAIQTGGPSGGCIPKELLDLPIDYDELASVGSIMGSGGMVVMDEDTCMVDVAKYFLSFLEEESCGKCLTCREGIERMLEIVERITEKEGKKEDIETLKELGEVVKDASMCQLGQTAPNPVLSTLKYFENEYLAHIREKKCPAKVCRALISFKILKDVCNGCGACRIACPEKAISGEKKKLHSIDRKKCIKCGICFETCKFDAIDKRAGSD
ncbi:MAG: NADH-quinone oxidoreductase subunit NuoF [Thermoplasmata archaeon]|nr:MAG: NADH-quinone oxidoreductase subunit NuoF [Thermoplasmata archaeon]